jgi:hypothetical protein
MVDVQNPQPSLGLGKSRTLIRVLPMHPPKKFPTAIVFVLFGPFQNK